MAQDRTRREDVVLTIDLGAGVIVPAQVLDHREGENREMGSGENITQEELDEIERLDREATPGPWAQDPHYPREINSNANPKLDVLVMLIEQLGSDTSEDKANLRLVAVMRTLLPRLARAYRALRVQRDALETDLANGHQAIEDLNQALDRSRAKLKDEYTRGRREAIEEAAKFLRKHLCQAQAQWITTHETEISK